MTSLQPPEIRLFLDFLDQKYVSQTSDSTCWVVAQAQTGPKLVTFFCPKIRVRLSKTYDDARRRVLNKPDNEKKKTCSVDFDSEAISFATMYLGRHITAPLNQSYGAFLANGRLQNFCRGEPYTRYGYMI